MSNDKKPKKAKAPVVHGIEQSRPGDHDETGRDHQGLSAGTGEKEEIITGDLKGMRSIFRGCGFQCIPLSPANCLARSPTTALASPNSM